MMAVVGVSYLQEESKLLFEFSIFLHELSFTVMCFHATAILNIYCVGDLQMKHFCYRYNADQVHTHFFSK